MPVPLNIPSNKSGLYTNLINRFGLVYANTIMADLERSPGSSRSKIQYHLLTRMFSHNPRVTALQLVSVAGTAYIGGPMLAMKREGYNITLDRSNKTYTYALEDYNPRINFSLKRECASINCTCRRVLFLKRTPEESIRNWEPQEYIVSIVDNYENTQQSSHPMPTLSRMAGPEDITYEM